MNTGKVILGVIAGASIGAIAGILMAPDKGAATRKKIINHTNDLRGLLNDWATGFIDNLKNVDDAISRGESVKAPDMRLNTMG
ncbi:MAG: YtxH domain-containing protein [Bacteroidota bacterium]